MAEAAKEREAQQLALKGLEPSERAMHDSVTLGGFEEVRNDIAGIKRRAVQLAILPAHGFR